MNRKHLLSAGLIVLGLSGAVTASAVAGEGRGPDPQRYQVPRPGDIKAGAARSEVHAPLDVVQKIVTDYGQYSEYISRFEKVKVIGRHGDVTDVYLQVPIMKGAAKVWAVVRFEPAKTSPTGDVVVVGRMLKGNVKRLDAKWKISKIDERNTNLDLELFIVPDFVVPVPNSLVAGEAAFAACKAVRGLRNASELRAQ